MANTKSAYKRIQIAERNRLRNKAYKSSIKTTLKKTLLSMSSSDKEMNPLVQNLISLAFSKIDKAIQKKIIHRNNGNSKKSLLAQRFKTYELKVGGRN